MADDAAQTPTSEAKEPPELPTFENYDVFEHIATGGMGSIYTAMRHGTTKLCVIKTLNANYAENEIVFARFLREAQVAALFDHPNISRLSDAKLEDDQLFIAMDFIAGQDLEALMHKLMREKKMLPPALSLTVAEQVLRGLHYAHEFKTGDEHLQVVHRDLSPRNVMLTFDGGIQIIDFGLARADVGRFRTAAKMVMGTLRYMSPEQALGERVDRRSDIYTLGTVLYENLSGRPFIRSEKHADVLPEILQRQPRPFEDLNVDVPPGMTEVVLKAMHKDARQRFQTAEEFRQALVAAAGPLASTPPNHIGDFLKQQFPAEHQAAMRRIFEVESSGADSTLPRDAPELIHTKVGAAPLPGEDVPMPSVDLPPEDSGQFERTQSVDRAVLELETSSDAILSRPFHPGPPKKKPSRAVVAAAALSVVAVVAVIFVVRAGPTEATEEPTKPAAPPPPSKVVARSAPQPELVAPPPPPPAKKTRGATKRRDVESTPPPPAAPPPPVAPPPKPKRVVLRDIEKEIKLAGSLELSMAERQAHVEKALLRIEARAKKALDNDSDHYLNVSLCAKDGVTMQVGADGARECLRLLTQALKEAPAP
ncbi:MAG: serine/threonine-protein kinase [Deltaproteobacteria bacterium]